MRYKNCREDRKKCECICQFNKNQKFTPRCNRNNNAVCSHGLTPTCLNPDNVASCQNKKLTCINKTDRSIDLNDTIECK